MIKMMARMKAVKKAVMAEMPLEPHEIALVNVPKFLKEPVWEKALIAVDQVMSNKPLQEASKIEAVLSFCPRCGQRPQDDRRKDESRRVLVELCPNVSRSEIDFALSLAYWVKR